MPSLRLDRLFTAQARRTPDAIALIDDSGSLTFAELDAASDRLAAAIRASGIRNAATVGIHMERSREYVIGVLAVLKANAAAAPLPPAYPAQHLRGILANLDGVIVDASGAHGGSLLHERTFRVSDTAPLSAIPADFECDPDSPAFVLCSSGSTGKPKMIVRSHRSFFHRLQWTWDTHPFEPGEVGCQKAYMTTTHAIYELFEPLLRGIPVRILSDRHARDIESFWDTLARERISRLLIVPSALQASLQMPGFASPALKVVVLMGEPVGAGFAADAAAAFPPATHLYSIYGSTEASSVLVSDLRMPLPPDGDIPLGTPVSEGVRACILGEDLEPVAEGATGMLHIAGSALFTGYFNAPGMTEAAFVTGRDGERLYRTNDWVRLGEHGALQFLGRTDHTVKIRGFRVDLSDVESALAQCHGVDRCAVVAKEIRGGDAILAAFISPADAPVAEAYRSLRARLPDYMVPSHIVGLDALPVTPSGKVDRIELSRNFDAHLPGTPRIRSAATTAGRLTEIWKDVLSHDAFGPGSNFFEIGGTSLKALSVISQTRTAFDLDRAQLAGESIYRFPTIESLAAYIDGLNRGNAPYAGPQASILVTLKSGRDGDASLFVIPSAGGTLGAYQKVIHALKTSRAIVGLRDPFLWGARDPVAGFPEWTTLYLDAIRKRQPAGPYYLMAYSSAGAFGYEIARQLQWAGERVALLALIEPLALDSAKKWRYGHWAMNARYMNPVFARIMLLGGWLRRLVPRRLRKSGDRVCVDGIAATQKQWQRFETEIRSDQQHLLQLSALLELDTGLPFALRSDDLQPLDPGQYMAALLEKARSIMPDIDAAFVERLVVQYQLQVRTQHRYRLRRFDGAVTLFDTDGPHRGLLAAQLRPYVARLTAHHLPLGVPSRRAHELAECLDAPIRSHYLCMRDETFTTALARELDKLL